MSDPKYPDDRGALWERKTRAGATYFTGIINDERVVCWANKSKQEGDNKPDYHVKLDKPRDGQPQQAQHKPAPPVDDDIPF